MSQTEDWELTFKSSNGMESVMKFHSKIAALHQAVSLERQKCTLVLLKGPTENYHEKSIRILFQELNIQH